MNFFKSILADDSDSAEAETDQESSTVAAPLPHEGGRWNNVRDAWTFGDLIKTLTVQSESVIETYRKDLQEFGAGLRKETEIFRETADRVVKDLPASLEATASAAHGALDEVLKSTVQIISKESLLFAPDGDPETSETNLQSFNSGRYSRFDAQLSTIQSDLNTFCEEPENVDDYGNWKLGFQLKGYEDEINNLIGDNGALENVYKRIVPNVVDPITFWCRYFYRVDKLNQQERLRASLVRRAMTVGDDDELTWDVDDEDEGSDVEVNNSLKGGCEVVENVISDRNLISTERHGDLNLDKIERLEYLNLNSGSHDMKKGYIGNVDNDEKSNVVEPGKDGNLAGEKGVKFEPSTEIKREDKSKEISYVKREDKTMIETIVEGNNNEKMGVELKEEFGKNHRPAQDKTVSEISVEHKNDENMDVVVKGESTKSHPLAQEQEAEEEDMGWDEIGDIGSDNDKKIEIATHNKSTNKADMRIQLSVAEDDEDLSWDIEDDDDK